MSEPLLRTKHNKLVSKRERVLVKLAQKGGIWVTIQKTKKHEKSFTINRIVL